MDKQIEEMARVICGFACDYENCDICPFNGLNVPCEHHDYAINLINAGYHKIPEGAVVLTGDELKNIERDRAKLKRLEEENTDLKYDKFALNDEISEKGNKIALLEEIIECIKFNVDFTRKETAEKFAGMLKANVNADINRCYALRIDGVAPLCRFIEQIDEICKEFTGDKI